MNDDGTRALGVALLLVLCCLLAFLVAMSSVDRWAHSLWRWMP
jgi:hypothetical protein